MTKIDWEAHLGCLQAFMMADLAFNDLEDEDIHAMSTNYDLDGIGNTKRISIVTQIADGTERCYSIGVEVKPRAIPETEALAHAIKQALAKAHLAMECGDELRAIGKIVGDAGNASLLLSSSLDISWQDNAYSSAEWAVDIELNDAFEGWGIGLDQETDPDRLIVAVLRINEDGQHDTITDVVIDWD